MYVFKRKNYRDTEGFHLLFQFPIWPKRPALDTLGWESGSPSRSPMWVAGTQAQQQAVLVVYKPLELMLTWDVAFIGTA